MKVSNLLKTVIFGLFGAFGVSCVSSESVPTAKNIDIDKYCGLWYEIARFDTRFQRGKYDSQAVYEKLDDGRIRIVNSAKNSDGERSSVEGIAYAPNTGDYSKLRVSFFFPFYGDYYILDVPPDYSWSIVGGASKDFLWILSRTPELPEDELSKILSKARSFGYDTSMLLFNSNLRATCKK